MRLGDPTGTAGGIETPTVDPGVLERGLVSSVELGLIDPGVAQRTRIVARLAGEGVVSGQVLATWLGVSRAAVHKHVDVLRLRGLQIDSTPGAGYRLGHLPWDLLVPEAVLPLLLGSIGGRFPVTFDGLPLGLPYTFVAEIESTNRHLREIGLGFPTGAVVVTDHQTQGRGRLGRRWVTEPGLDLTFSVLLRPHVAPLAAPQLVLAASAAVADAIAALPGMAERVTIKWPNDVLIDGRKVCGILSEGSLDMDTVHWLILGIGVNVNGRPAAALAAAQVAESTAAPAALGETFGVTVPRAPLLAGILARLGARLEQVEAGAFAEVLSTLAERDALRGKEVVVRSGYRGADVVAEGIASGLAPDGELLVRLGDGRVTAVAVGEVTLAAPGDEPAPEVETGAI